MNSPGIKKFTRYFLIFFGIGTIIGIFNTSIVVTTMLAEREKVKLIYPAIGELTGSYSFMILLPIMLWVFRKYPVSKRNFIKPLFIYLAVYIPVGMLHICFMYFSRQWINDLAGWGKYDYGDITYRIMMEYIKMSTGIIVAYLIYNLMRSFKEKEKEKIKRAQLEEQLAKNRLEILKSQLNPHFLFNTLNMISSAMYENVDKADNMISNLSTMLRATLQTSTKGEFTLREEIELLNLYLSIMKARFNDKLEIMFSIDPACNNAVIPHFLLQPLVENSIKYGMENLSGTKIELSVSREDERLIIKIKDNGPGIKEDYDSVIKKGFGLASTVERLEKTYNKNFGFNWTNLKDGLLLTIDIPFTNENNNGRN